MFVVRFTISHLVISSASIVALLDHFHLTLSEEDMDALLAHLDPNGSGRIEYPTFFKCEYDVWYCDE
jgi:Ca2+-binding EF-hand superfamily protein